MQGLLNGEPGAGRVADTEKLRVLECVFRATSDATLVTTATLEPPGPTIVLVNPELTRLTGYAAEDVTGKWLGSLGAESDFIERLRHALAGGAPCRLEIACARKDGTKLDAELCVTPARGPGAKITHLVCTLRDLTESRRAARAIEDSTAKFDLVARATNVAVWEWDLETGTVALAQGFQTLFGYELGQLRADAAWWAEAIHPADRQAVVSRRYEDIEAGKEAWSNEYRFRRAAGSYADVFDRGLVLRGASGRPVRMIGAMMDITERKQMQARLQLADRMASVGTMAAGVAHEINNPLAYVVSNIGYAVDEVAAIVKGAHAGTAATDPQRSPAGALLEALHALEEAREGAERVRLIVRDLKTFSRSEDDRRSLVDVRRVIELSINMAQNEIRHRAQLVRELADVPPVEANESRLGQVFLNLLVNAAQAIPEGAADKNEIRITMRSDGAGHVVVEVRDTGPGIRPEIMASIFDPFFTTKSVGEGTGLGLAICHTIVTDLGGDIQVDSQLGRGTVFRVALPAARDEVRPVAVEEEAPSSVRRGRILVVDDEPMIGRSVRRTFGRQHDVVALESARSALGLLSSGEEFDIILCDLMMPEMTGMELHAEIRRLVPAHLERMVFLTGGAFTPRAREFLERVPNQRIEKPFDLQALRAVIRDRLR